MVGGVFEPGGVFKVGVSGLSEVMLSVIELSTPASAVSAFPEQAEQKDG